MGHSPESFEVLQAVWARAAVSLRSVRGRSLFKQRKGGLGIQVDEPASPSSTAFLEGRPLSLCAETPGSSGSRKWDAESRNHYAGKVCTPSPACSGAAELP